MENCRLIPQPIKYEYEKIYDKLNDMECLRCGENMKECICEIPIIKFNNISAQISLLFKLFLRKIPL